MFLSDHETEVDLLYYEAIAQTVVKLIRENTTAPLTVGVHGDWGAGKSSVLAMTQKALAADKDVVCLKFDGWLFQGFEDAKAVLIENIIAELRRVRPDHQKVLEYAKSLLQRVDWLKLTKKAAGVALTAAVGFPMPSTVEGILSTLKALAGKATNSISVEEIKAAIAKSDEYIKEAQAKNVPDEMHKFREEFQALLNAAEIKQLVVFVDDLDRCLPKTAIETLEAIRLFLFVPKTAFVVAADEAMIEYSVKQHFPDLPLAIGPLTYARNYLEKLVQVPFRIPVLGYAETRVYITLALVEAELGTTNEQFVKLLTLARDVLRKPWQNKSLDRSSVEKCLGGIPKAAEKAIQLSGQITQTLTEGTKGNPRQIKRFLNSLLLRESIADARGFGSELNRPVLAKVMLAERFASEFYEELAKMVAVSPTGKPEHIGQLEQRVCGNQKNTKRDEEDPASEKNVEEWLKTEWIKRWAAIPPPLGEVDLRPYFFITRDKRSHFGGVATTSPLDALIYKLMGPELAVHGEASGLGKLQPADAEYVFDAIRDRILQTGQFDTKPAGIDGLIALVKAQPRLQTRLITFLESLPAAKLGSWVAAGWNQCIVDEAARQQLQSVFRTWADQTDNKSLKAAVSATSKLATSKKR